MWVLLINTDHGRRLRNNIMKSENSLKTVMELLICVLYIIEDAEAGKCFKVNVLMLLFSSTFFIVKCI